MRLSRVRESSLVLVCRLQILLLLPLWAIGFIIPSLQTSSFSLRRRFSTQPCNAFNNQGNTTETSIPPCPFVKFFPRYRIDLTSKRMKAKESSWIPSPLKELGKSQQRARVKGLLKPGEEFVWIPDMDGISAVNQLWRHVDRLLRSIDSSVVVSLPDASPSLLQNWIEIFEWMIANYPFPSNHSDVLAVTKVRTGTSEDGRETTLRIQRTGGMSIASHNVPDNPDLSAVNRRTQAWVKRILVEQGICPFTKSITKSGQGLADVGVPVGSIAYHSSAATHPVTLFADTFAAIEAMMQAGPSGKTGVSSILLAAPAYDDDFDLWSGPIFAMLEASVVAAMAESQVGVVCFHPRYAVPDGSSWPGFGHMHSVTRLQKWYQESSISGNGPILGTQDIAAGGAWQRRTPHATINVLRADQLEAAEPKRSSSDLYATNIDRLVGARGIGSDQLARDLERERQIQ